MNHFSPNDWIALSRGVLTPPSASMMQAHLDRRCDECLSACEASLIILAVLSNGEDGKFPDRSVVPSESPLHLLNNVVRLTVPVFDSLTAAPPAALRSSPSFSRQVVHEAEPFVIDLRLEYGSNQRVISLVGQVLNHQNPEEPAGIVDVVLLSEETLVTKTRADTSGEFHIEFDPEPNLQLLINIEGHRAIGLVLPELGGQ